MADKIKNSYRFSKSFYDDAITQGKWWSKLYFTTFFVIFASPNGSFCDQTNFFAYKGYLILSFEGLIVE